MYTISTRCLTLDEAKKHFDCLAEADLVQRAPQEVALSGCELWLEGWQESDAPSYALIVRVPGKGREELRQLVSQEVQLMNRPSEDLLQQETFAILGSTEHGLYVPLWRSKVMRLLGDVRVIRVILLGDEHVVDACHVFCEQALDDYLVGCQAQMDSSGPHYVPHRYHSEKEIEEARTRGGDFMVPGFRVHLDAPSGWGW